MIPTHGFSDKAQKAIVVNELAGLSDYDFSEPHRHHYFELFVFIKGGGTHKIDFEEFPIRDHSIHIVAPGRVHEVRRELDSYGFVFLFETDVLLANYLMTDFFLDHTCYTVQEHAPDYHFPATLNLEEIAARMWKDSQAAGPLKNEFLLHNLSLLCIYCMRNQEGRAVHSGGSNSVYFRFRRLLHDRFRELKKVKEYASLLAISEKQLNEAVKAHSGASASALIYKQLILEAKRLLNLGLSAKEAAYELAFDDPGHFSKFFKTQTGFSPSEFQKIHA